MATDLPADRVLEVARLLTTALREGAGGAKVVVLDLEGLPDVDVSDPARPEAARQDGQGARSESEAFSALGAVSRPLPPAGGQHALYLCVRSGDELIPLGVADPRLALPGAGPGAGAVGHVGYGGGFVVTQPVDPEDLSQGSIHTIYCPFDVGADGVAGSAHVVQVHPTKGVTVAHADGMALVLHDGKTILRGAGSGGASIVIDGASIQLLGNVQVVGSIGQTKGVVTYPLAAVGLPPNVPITGGPTYP